MDTSTFLTIASIVVTLVAQVVVLTWKTGSLIRSVEQKMASIDKKFSVEIAEIKVRLSDLLNGIRK